MITDRRRPAAGGVDGLVRQVAAAARAGVHLVQIRERDLDARALVDFVGACVAAVHGLPTRIVVNDRTDVALAARAHGVHLRADSVAPARIRPIVPPGFLIGRSVHSAEEALHIDGGSADYLIFGPVFETLSKPGLAPAGPGALEAVVRATTVPVLAVGGVTPETAAAVGRTGAAGVAAIGMFAGAPDEKAVQEALSRLRNAFDSASRRS